jgi:23S rRNA (guanosine2251-2'-O)-methyltransferase
VKQGEQVEGRHAVLELLRARRRKIHSIWIAEGQDRAPILDEIAQLAEARGVQLRRVGGARLAAEAQTSAPQGVIARADPVPMVPLDELLAGPRGVTPFVLAIEGVTDPRNLGGLLRTAVGAGVTGALFPRHRSSPLTTTAVKAAAGAVEVLPLCVVGGLPAALARARERHLWVVGLDPGAPAIWDLDLASEPLMLVVGAEGGGLTRLARARCDALAGVPMTGPLESLNVGAAAAIALFDVARRRNVP